MDRTISQNWEKYATISAILRITLPLVTHLGRIWFPLEARGIPCHRPTLDFRRRVLPVSSRIQKGETASAFIGDPDFFPQGARIKSDGRDRHQEQDRGNEILSKRHHNTVGG